MTVQTGRYALVPGWEGIGLMQWKITLAGGVSTVFSPPRLRTSRCRVSPNLFSENELCVFRELVPAPSVFDVPAGLPRGYIGACVLASLRG